MNCKTCGSTVDISDKYCPVCGEKIVLIDDDEETIESDLSNKQSIYRKKINTDKVKIWGLVSIFLLISISLIVIAIGNEKNNSTGEATVSDISDSGDIEASTQEENSEEVEDDDKTVKFGRTVLGSDIKWDVIFKQMDSNGREMQLLISREDLIIDPYEESGIKTTWKDCSLRQWLNNDFYSRFTASEKEAIIPSVNGTPITDAYGEDEDFVDYVFLLDEYEASNYLSKEDRNGHNVDEYYADGWWLRSPGVHVDPWGEIVNGGGVSGELGVRPVIWVYRDMVDGLNDDADIDEISKIIAHRTWEGHYCWSFYGNNEIGDTLACGTATGNWRGDYIITDRHIEDGVLYLEVEGDPIWTGEEVGSFEIWVKDSRNILIEGHSYDGTILFPDCIEYEP